MMVIQRYQPRYLLLGINHPKELAELYINPGDRSGLTYLSSVEDTHIFLIDEGGS
jgi:hypothetical protein